MPTPTGGKWIEAAAHRSQVRREQRHLVEKQEFTAELRQQLGVFNPEKWH